MSDLIVVESQGATVVVQEVVAANIIEVVTPGPQGARGDKGDPGDKGDTGDVTPEATAAKVAAEAAAVAAAASQTAAAGSATSASTSASTATTQAAEASASAATATTQAATATTKASEASASATNAATQAGVATAQAAAATTKASEASESATSAATQAGVATTKADEASASAATATTQAGVAATQAGIATTKASEASTSASTATTQAGTATTKAAEASASAATADTHATTATTQAGVATTKAGEAASSATAAASSESAVAASATTATTQAGIATTKAGEAATSASTASTQAGVATTKAGEAASSATAAGSAQVAAEAARDQTLAAFDSFDDRYLGQKSVDPTVDNDGDPLVGGALYFNTNPLASGGGMKVYDAANSSWLAAYASLSDALIAANNLSDLANASAARTNLGLGNVENKTAATILGELSSSNVTTALGFTPYNATNPTGFITSSALAPYLTSATADSTYQTILVSGTSIKTVNGQSVLGSGNIQIDGGVTSFNTRTGAVTLSSGDVTGALGFTPYNATNPSGYITASASITGNAATATALQTARTINGVSFNGTADITISDGTKLPLAGGTMTGGLTVGGNLGLSGNSGGVRVIGPIAGTNTTLVLEGSSASGSSANIELTRDNLIFLDATQSRFRSQDASVSFLNISSGATNVLTGALQQQGNQVLHAGNVTTYAVTPTDTQTLTNKTLNAAVLNDGYTEEVFAVTGTTPALSPTNGSIQTWTLSGNSTPTAGTWASGQSLTLMVDDDTAYTIDWSSVDVTWKTNGGTAPTLNTTGFTAIQLWKVDTVIYGARVGDA
jgi:hypothetical protein